MAGKSINLNSASASELRSIYGIGSQSAKRLVRYRESNNGKLAETDLEKVPNLRLATVTKIKEQTLTNAKPSTSKMKPRISSQSGKVKLVLPVSELDQSDIVQVSFAGGNLVSSHGEPLDNLTLQMNRNAVGGGLNIKVPISKHTAPGSYQTDVTAGSTTFKTTIDVVENIQVSASPNRLILDMNQSSVEKEIILKNNGNVPVQIKSPGAVMLEVEHIDCRVIRGVVSNLRKRNANAKSDLESVLDLASKELELLYSEAGVMRATLVGKSYSLAAGEIKKFTFKFTIPSTLKDRAYNGSIHFHGAIVNIHVASN